MLSKVFFRGPGSTILKKILSTSTKCVSVSSIHTSTRDEGTLGEFVQTMRFKYGNNIRHNLDNDKWAKIFVVEGNIKSGKGDFAKEFAEKLDLRYFPCADPEYVIREYTRPDQLDHTLNFFRQVTQLSLAEFYGNPQHWEHLARYQKEIMTAKLFQYANAVCHLIWTGQGCVLERDVFGLEVFDHALMKMNWISDKIGEYFYVMRKNMERPLITPQCIIYLDVPPEQCHEKLQSSDKEWERKIPLEFLHAMDEGYNMKHLPGAPLIGTKVIRFDWSKPDNVDDVIIHLDDMSSLQVAESRWDSPRARLMRYYDLLSEQKTLNQLAFSGFVTDIEELWYPDWSLWAYDHYRSTMPQRKEKFSLFKSDPPRKVSFKRKYGWLFTGMNPPPGI